MVFENRRLILILILLILFAFASACSPERQYMQVRLAKPGSTPRAATEAARAPLRVAVSGVISPKETFKAYQDLLRYLEERIGRPVELVQRKTYAEVNNLIRDGGIDLAFVCTLAYVQGREEFGMEALAAPEVDGEPFYRAYVIVPADSPVERFEQLRGRVFAFTDPDSNTGRLVPTHLLWQMAATPESFFRKVVYTYSHDNSIKAVADKLVDGGSVDSLVYESTVARHPDLAARTRVIFRSAPFGTPPVVVHPGLGSDLKGRLREIVLGVADDPEGRVILDGLNVDRFVEPRQESYAPIRLMLEEVRGQR